MLRAFVNIGKLRSEARFSSCLVAIVINAARSSKRKSKHFHWLYLDEIQESEDRRQAWVVPDTLNELERSGGIGLVMLGRPYHHDPGLNQGILEELQRLGYPIFSQSLLPLDTDLLDRLSGAEVQAGLIRSPPDISNVWKHTFSASSNHKIWAAKFVARHPNLISVELSNFKCGHDAFISRVVEQPGKPHFSFRDLDENRPWPLPTFALRQCTTSSDITGNNLRKVRALLLDPEQHVARRPHVWAQQRCASERKVRGANDPFYEMAHINTPKQKTTFSRGIVSQH